MNIPNKVKAYLMDTLSDEYREITDDGYWVWRGSSVVGAISVSSNLQWHTTGWQATGFGPLFWDIPAKYGTDRYLIGWIEEDDAVTEIPA